MGKYLLIAVLFVQSVLLSGCMDGLPQKDGGKASQKQNVEATKEDGSMVAVIKKVVFDENRSMPVGKALADYSYFVHRDWKEIKTANGTIYVDFIGRLDTKTFISWSRNDLVAQTIIIKFVIKPDATCFVGMVTLYETTTDGKSRPIPVTDVAGFMKAIYANSEPPLPKL